MKAGPLEASHVGGRYVGDTSHASQWDVSRLAGPTPRSGPPRTSHASQSPTPHAAVSRTGRRSDGEKEEGEAGQSSKPSSGRVAGELFGVGDALQAGTEGGDELRREGGVELRSGGGLGSETLIGRGVRASPYTPPAARRRRGAMGSGSGF